RETRVDLALLAAPDLVDGRWHIGEDPTPRRAAEHAEGVIVGVEQHLVGLLRIGAENERAAVAELEVGDLQFGPLARDDRPVLRPVELERSAGQERQRNKDAAAAGLQFSLPGQLSMEIDRKGPLSALGPRLVPCPRFVSTTC